MIKVSLIAVSVQQLIDLLLTRCCLKHLHAKKLERWCQSVCTRVKKMLQDKKGAQLAPMKTVRIFNPLHVLGNKILVSDINGLKIFKLYEHPEIRVQIEVTKPEVMKY